MEIEIRNKIAINYITEKQRMLSQTKDNGEHYETTTTKAYWKKGEKPDNGSILNSDAEGNHNSSTVSLLTYLAII